MSIRGTRSAPLAAIAAAAAIVSGCGGGGNKNVDVGPAAAVPAHTPIYIDASVRPTGTAEADAKAAAGKILGTNDPGGKLISLITKGAQANEKPGQTFNWQQDVEPWLGEKLAIFWDSFQSKDPTVVAESKNNNAALTAERENVRDTGQTASYKGHTYDVIQGGKAFGAVGNFVVYGPTRGFQQAVDAFEGDSLGDSSDFKNAIGDLPDNRLGALYTIPKDFIAAIPSSQFAPSVRSYLEKSSGGSLEKPVSGAVTASANSINLDVTGGSSGVETRESSLLGEVPSQSWLALGIGNLGDAAKRAIDQLKSSAPNIAAVLSQVQSTTGATIDQLTGALGDAAIYVEGTTQSTLSGALVLQTKDASLTGRLLTQLQSLLSLGGQGGVKPLTLSGGGTGFQINNPSVAPRPVEIAQQGDKIVIGYGAGSAEQTLTPASTLSSQSSFTKAKDQVSSLGTDFYLSFPAVFALAEAGGAKKNPGYVSAKPYLDTLEYLVSGSGTKSDKTEVKAVLGLK